MNSIQKHQIFIVDDSRIQLILLEKVLKKEGFSVHSFTDGLTLLQSLEENQPSLIISDIDMPMLNGFELIYEVRDSFGEVDIPVFLISSDGGITVEEKAREAGAEVFLQKPFKYNVLTDVIRERLGPVAV